MDDRVPECRDSHASSSHRATRLSSDHRVALEQGSARGLRRLCFVCLCSVVFDSPSLCLNASAGVAFLLTLLAITARDVRTGALGRRGFALESALARVCREAGGRVATNLFVRNVDLGIPSAGVVVDGLLLFGGQLAVDTTLVSALRRMANLGGVLQTGMEWLWQWRVASKRERTQNWLIRAAGHVLWCLLLRLAGDGQKRLRSSSVCWPGHVSDPNPGCCKDVWSKRGG